MTRDPLRPCALACAVCLGSGVRALPSAVGSRGIGEIPEFVAVDADEHPVVRAERGGVTAAKSRACMPRWRLPDDADKSWPGRKGAQDRGRPLRCARLCALARRLSSPGGATGRRIGTAGARHVPLSGAPARTASRFQPRHGRAPGSPERFDQRARPSRLRPWSRQPVSARASSADVELRSLTTRSAATEPPSPDEQTMNMEKKTDDKN